MTSTEFLERDASSYAGVLQAVWFAGRGEWEQAHQVAQSLASREAAWVHAYLHRAEGDTSNASYWYRRAGRPVEIGDLRAEWETITRELLKDQT